MSETPNYGLYVEDDLKTKFTDWREKMNGTVDSNMTKIDSILATKADRSTIVTAVLDKDAWTAQDDVYIQNIPIEGLKPETNGSISLTSDVTPEQLDAAIRASMLVSTQTDGALTVTAYGQVPQVNIPVSIILLN